MCPPGTDQTERTKQRWTLLSPWLQEKYDLTNQLAGSRDVAITQFLKSSSTWDAFDKLAQYDRDIEGARSILLNLPNRSDAGSSSSLARLPPEIISMIISSQFLDAADIMSLGLSSRLLWIHVLDHVALQCRKAPWAGVPLLCTGSYLKSVPQAIHALKPHLKEQELAFFGRPGSEFPYGGTCPARNFNRSALSTYTDRTEHSRNLIWLESFARVSEGSAIPEKSLKVLRRSLEAIIVLKKSSTPQAWTLRNHNIKEYISLKTDTLHGNIECYIHVNGLPMLSLDKALILRILWSAPYSNKDPDEVGHAVGHVSEYSRLILKLQRGSWAGHCFDVVPTASSVDSRQGWKDVTSDVVAEATAWKVVR